jgi:hypothetical protein
MMNLLGAFAACVFAVAIPLWYYLVSITETRYSLKMEVTYLSKSIENIIQSRPDMWEFEFRGCGKSSRSPCHSGNNVKRKFVPKWGSS